jgi:hypothetical protein
MRFEANTNQLATVSMSVPVIEISWATLDGAFEDKKSDRQVSATASAVESGFGTAFPAFSAAPHSQN